MGQAERQYGKDVTVLTLGTLNLLGRFVSMTISEQVETADNRACMDTAAYPVGLGDSCDITLEEAVESTTYDLLMAAVGTSVLFSYTAIDGSPHIMQVLIATGEHAVRREGQNITVRAMRQGAATS
jgi:hypothetical protein